MAVEKSYLMVTVKISWKHYYMVFDTFESLPDYLAAWEKSSEFFLCLIMKQFRFSAFFFGFSTILCTIYDCLARQFKWKSSKYSQTFSVLKNSANIFRIDKSQSVINCIDGIKVISAIWIICGHRQERLKKNYTHSVIERIVHDSVSSFTEAVVTFLVCSAVLITQSLIKGFERFEEN